MEDLEDVELGQHNEIVDDATDGEFTLVNAERPDDTRLITIVAGLEKTKIQLPRTLTCTLSPVIADMMQKALKQQQQKKNHGAFEHVPRLKDGVEVDDENILDFASHGQGTALQSYTLLAQHQPSDSRSVGVLVGKFSSFYAVWE